MKKYFSIVILAIALTSCKSDKKEPEATTADIELYERVAAASGIDGWNDVKQAKFTFNVDRNGETVVSRDWDWRPQSGEVTLTSKNETLTYNRNSLKKTDSLAISADRGFINDVYWLLPQFKLVWDQGTQITYPDSTTQMVRIKYTGNDGYTPGDQYDMDIDNDMMISNWKYYPKGTTQPGMETSFENYKDYNGIKIATDHKIPDGSTNIYFTNVEIIK